MATNPNSNTPQEAFIPPSYMLIVALAGLVVAVGVALTQPTFTVVGWGALGVAALALFAWVLMAPQQARAVLTGRTTRYGGTSIIITVIFIAALVAIYVLIRGRELRVDLTESNQFSLTAESRQAIAGLGVDPNLPQIKLLAFYGASQAGSRDQDTLLFDDYARTSGGKISYEFIDPDRNPQLTELYKITRPGQIAVVALQEGGTPDAANAQLVSFVSQDQLTNAILRVAAQGDFRAYVLNVEGGLQLTDTGTRGMSLLNNELTQRYDWKTKQVSLFDLMGEQSADKLNDPAADGEVLVIAGGDKPLTDEEVKFITDYLDNGGSLVLFAAPGITASGQGDAATVSASQPLALTPALADYLFAKFGIRVNRDVVLDPAVSLGSPLIPVAVNFSTTSYITRNFQAGRSGVVFELPHSIEVATALPENVTVEELIRTSENAYAKTDIQILLDNPDAAAQTDDDPKGPFVLAASAENSVTGARVVLFGSSSVPANNFAVGSGLVNLQAAFNSLVWATRFNDFFSTVNIQSAARPQDAPVFATDQQLREINLLTIFLLPFGVLIIGLLVWWNNRERVRMGGR